MHCKKWIIKIYLAPKEMPSQKVAVNYFQSTEFLNTVQIVGTTWNIGKDCDAYSLIGSKLDVNAFGETPAIALCKLLIAINPDPIKPVPKKEDIESTVVEASFA